MKTTLRKKNVKLKTEWDVFVAEAIYFKYFEI